ncbi:MAG: hypothetical protein Q4C96_11580 [Planctomycetia bacterium]|nr:hypothetical protein [Planctomycetia bacterium]
MHLLNKIFIWLIFIALLPAFYFGARTLKVHSVWRQLYNERTAELQKEKMDNYIIKHGEGDPSDPKSKPSLGRLETTLRRLQTFRGLAAWFDCPVEVDNSGNARLVIEDVNENAIPPGTRVYAFEVTNEEAVGKYMGMFTVEDVAQGEVVLSADPSRFSYPRIRNMITRSNANWTIYTVMPTDEHDVFNIMNDEEREDFLTRMIPKADLEYYLNDGKVDSKTGEVYERPLVAYDVIFELNLAENILLADQLVVATYEEASLRKTAETAEAYRLLRENEKRELVQKQTASQEEVNTIREVNQKLSRVVDNYNRRETQYLKDIRAKAMEIVNHYRAQGAKSTSRTTQ